MTERAASATATRALTVPSGVLDALRAALLATDDGDVRLRDAGFDAGHALYDDFAGWLAARDGVADPAGASLDAFVGGLSTYVAARNWGTLALEPADPSANGGLPGLRADDWFEVQADATAPFPSCHFTTGMLAGLLSRVAGRPLAVLEVACASCGDAACRFVVGSADALAPVHAARYTS